jgi:hypothetical protein
MVAAFNLGQCSISKEGLGISLTKQETLGAAFYRFVYLPNSKVLIAFLPFSFTHELPLC